MPKEQKTAEVIRNKRKDPRSNPKNVIPVVPEEHDTVRSIINGTPHPYIRNSFNKDGSISMITYENPTQHKRASRAHLEGQSNNLDAHTSSRGGRSNRRRRFGKGKKESSSPKLKVEIPWFRPNKPSDPPTRAQVDRRRKNSMKNSSWFDSRGRLPGLRGRAEVRSRANRGLG